MLVKMLAQRADCIVFSARRLCLLFVTIAAAFSHIGGSKTRS